MISSFKAYNLQEEVDKMIIERELHSKDVFTRDNEFGHFTASSWIFNETHDKVLLVYHNIYDEWAWTGGHADGEIDLLKQALNEAMEETGLKNINVVTKDILSLEVLRVKEHIKHNKLIKSHFHYNLTFLFEASETEELVSKPDENKGVKWVTLDDVKKECKDDWFYENVYKKLTEKSLLYFKNGSF